MAMSLLMLMFGAVFVLAVALRRARGTLGPVNSSGDPLCGGCGYCVRGLAGDICPECGGDLRVVGIVQPGDKRPIARRWRLVLWTAGMLPVAFVFTRSLADFIGPQFAFTQQMRVIFCQTSYCNTTITANATRKKLVFGTAQANRMPPVVPELIFLSTNNVNQSLTIDVANGTCGYFDAAGKGARGKYDAKAIEVWLNAQGFTDPRVADEAAKVFAAVNEIGTPAGAGFTRFSPDRSGNRSPGIAHPTSFVPSQPKWIGVTYGFVVAVMLLIWLCGLPFVLRKRPRHTLNELPLAASAASL